MGQRAVGDDQGQRSEVVGVGLDVRNQVVSCAGRVLSLTLALGPPESLQQRGTVRCGAAPSAWATSTRALSGIDLGNDWLS